MSSEEYFSVLLSEAQMFYVTDSISVFFFVCFFVYAI